MRVSHFNGKYNASKSKLFMLWVDNVNSWFSPRDMHSILGVPLETCRGQCRRLYKARPPYIRRRLIGDKWHQYCYQYRLGSRGMRWYVNAIAAGLPRELYMQEISAWQQQRDGIKNE
jgi:hypothetical protein